MLSGEAKPSLNSLRIQGIRKDAKLISPGGNSVRQRTLPNPVPDNGAEDKLGFAK